jgi:CheY-like chemotaxis protein
MASIVLIEDDAGPLMLVRSVLSKEGHEVATASDGVEGLALIQAVKPDLVVSDVHMPRLNGFEMLAQLRSQAEFTALPVILLVNFRQLLGGEGVEELLAQTINVALELKLIEPQELSRVIVDSTVQPKAIAHPTDSRLLEVAGSKRVAAAKAAGIKLKQTFAKEGTYLARKAARYAHPRQWRRMRRALKRQRTIVGRLWREVDRKASAIGAAVRQALGATLDKARRIVHRGKIQRMSEQERGLLRRRPAIEPIIGHLKRRSPHGPLPSPGRDGRPAACGAVRSRLQHPLAAAHDCQKGHPRPAGLSFTPVAAGRGGGKIAQARLDARTPGVRVNLTGATTDC